MSYFKRMKLWILLLSMLLQAGCSRESVILETGETLAKETIVFAETEQEIHRETEDSKALIYVYVCGQVVSPGVYALTQGDRIYQAIEMAGGALPEGDLGRMNLAALLGDGQKVYVPSYEETEVLDVVGESSGDVPLANGMSESSGRVNINQASREELMSLPGIGTAKADAILSYRQEHGAFQLPEDLMQVPGIKEGTYAQIKDRISIN